MPDPSQFDYSFERLSEVVESFLEAKGVANFALYMMDYGAPIGFRIAVRNPGRVTGLVIQNGNAYEEGLEDFWTPLKAYWAAPDAEHEEPLRNLTMLEATRWQYIHGTRDPESISPDTWTIDQSFLDRPGNQEIQMRLFLSYGTNPPLYPQWQDYLRTHQPPTLIVWGKNDEIFPATGAHPYKRDLDDLESHLLETGHFALEEEGEMIADSMKRFFSSRMPADACTSGCRLESDGGDVR